jgi:hypothetical protein
MNRPWVSKEAQAALASYKKRTSPSSGNTKSPRTSASLMRLRKKALNTIARKQNYEELKMANQLLKMNRMIKEIKNYAARHRYKLVVQPNGSLSLARRDLRARAP